MSGIFGWSLPPGCSHKDIEDAFGDRPCELCGEDPDNCVCPVCKKCQVQGDPACYVKHGLVKSALQIETLKKNQTAWKRANDAEC